MSLLAPGPRPRVRSLVTPACGSSPATCETGEALRLVSKAHVVDALHLLSQGNSVRFNELRSTLRVTASVLSLRLKDLVDAGLVVRVDLGTVPPAVEYKATRAGHELLEALGPLRRWGERHAGR